MPPGSEMKSPEVTCTPKEQPEPARAPALEKAPATGNQQQVQLVASSSPACYANFCRVTGTPEELIIDFALNAHPFSASEEPLRIEQRVVTNYFTAKRMLLAVQMTLQRHETAFGVLELDVQKRAEAGRS